MNREAASSIFSYFLAVIGVIASGIEIYNFYVAEQKDYAVFILSIIVIVVVALAAASGIWWFVSQPKKKYSFHVNGREVRLELVVGDIFKQNGPIIVGSNVDFVTSIPPISPNSIQGLYVSRYGFDLTTLDALINNQIGNGPHELGTVAHVRHREKDAYFCAMATLNQNGVAKTTLNELMEALGKLWVHLENKGEMAMYNVPVLGSRFGRLTDSSEAIIYETVKSFLASLTDSSYCEGLRIVLLKKDVKEKNIDIAKIAKFIEHSCEHVNYSGGNDQRASGSPVQPAIAPAPQPISSEPVPPAAPAITTETAPRARASRSSPARAHPHPAMATESSVISRDARPRIGRPAASGVVYTGSKPQAAKVDSSGKSEDSSGALNDLEKLLRDTKKDD